MHAHWHEAMTGYADADDFTMALNAAIVAGRSVTLVMQKELSKQEGFDAWYAPLQDGMRRDPRMRWLVDARNAVLKEGDLDIASEALVSLALTGGEELLSRIAARRAGFPFEQAWALAAEAALSHMPPGAARSRWDVLDATERGWSAAYRGNADRLAELRRDGG